MKEEEAEKGDQGARGAGGSEQNKKICLKNLLL
jgi:hypothetical protein